MRRITALGAPLLLLAAALAGADDRLPPPRHTSEDPDLGFLEFLGSVDGLSEANPDYLAQARAPGASRPRVAPPPPAPPAPQPPEKKNE
ncbi:MAG: hypothetical protein JO341_12860 [Gammaproteobacteria bacterium]|nr:hypothetical protein [Gammaproteobacteria bacterium]